MFKSLLLPIMLLVVPVTLGGFAQKAMAGSGAAAQTSGAPEAGNSTVFSIPRSTLQNIPQNIPPALIPVIQNIFNNNQGVESISVMVSSSNQASINALSQLSEDLKISVTIEGESPRSFDLQTFLDQITTTDIPQALVNGNEVVVVLNGLGVTVTLRSPQP